MARHGVISVYLVLHITLCLTIRVPVGWNNDSEVKLEERFLDNNGETTPKNLRKEYFQYTAQKPQFAIDIAAAHNVKSPEKVYTSYPIRPYTGIAQPVLGKHHMLDSDKDTFEPYQRFINKNNDVSYVTPASTAFEVYHPYKAEEPALQEVYKDPILEKIRNDIRDSKNRLQQYESDAGQSNINADEYLESPEQIDINHSAHKNKPTLFEIHKHIRRPIYYRQPPRYSHRHNVLNKKLRHPWNQNYVKITPGHYQPLKNHLNNLRQGHAIKFDDEQNEYPQQPIPDSHTELPDGFDIYKSGKDKYIQLRNNVDESLNKAKLETKPNFTKEKLELNPYPDKDDDYDDHHGEAEFVPLKNYAQVRKTEVTKHLPKEAAFQDAENWDEIKNAPRLREAVKSDKAQIVYSEEGYEDSAYDHAGEEKHASDQEGHGGYLKDNELSGGKYKTPSLSASYEDRNGSVYGDKVVHGDKWENINKNNEEDAELEEYTENDQDNSEETDIYADTSNVDKTEVLNKGPNHVSDRINRNNLTTRSKRQDISQNNGIVIDNEVQHKPKNNSIYLSLDQLAEPPTKENISDISVLLKYPYYFKNTSSVNNNSPLRYALNLKFIPKKTLGGTEFYDSRTEINCPLVDDEVDPIPEKLKNDGHPDANNKEIENSFASRSVKKNERNGFRNKQRLKGLGDKIDCLKSKYFGEDPLDNPFFKEEVILSPEPELKPNFKDFIHEGKSLLNSRLEKYNQTNARKQFLNPKDIATTNELEQNSLNLRNINRPNFTETFLSPRTPYPTLQNNSQLIKGIRSKRSTPFIYEPYKIIKESQIQDSKKTTTTNNISPLIKQLQSSRVVDRVTTYTNKDQVLKKNDNAKLYKDIGKLDRQQRRINESDDFHETDFVDKRRGEPKYEHTHHNHKSQYTPVEHKKSMSIDEYKDQSGLSNVEESQIKLSPHSRSYFDVSKYLPVSFESQNSAASNAVPKIILTSRMNPPISSEEVDQNENGYRNNDSYGHIDQQKNPDNTAATIKSFRGISKRIKILTTSTEKSILNIEENNSPKLRLVTRFRNYQQKKEDNTNSITTPKSQENEYYAKMTPTINPKYKEKKKKISKSTIVTDTKTYGNGYDDMKKDDIDALIGIRQNNDDYLPQYEKDLKENKNSTMVDEEQSNEEEYDEEEEKTEDNQERDDEYEDEEIEGSDNEYEDDLETLKGIEPKTMETDTATAQVISAAETLRPIVLRKKIEFHRESPVDKISPNITQFKQDIKEVEIIKEFSPKIINKSRKPMEPLDLYKDENLAKDINKLGGVEVFREDIDIRAGPKHGGNYHSVDTAKVSATSSAERDRNKYKRFNGTNNTRRHLGKRNRISIHNEDMGQLINPINADESTLRPTTENNFNLFEGKEKLSAENKMSNSKQSQINEANVKNNNEELQIYSEISHIDNVKNDHTLKEAVKQNFKNADGNGIVLLSGYARAVPILTTTPAYILDPSKRRYYYVDA